jgi:isohexenylglutaconyl-CoA hydratase
MSSEPAYENIRLRRDGWVAHLTFARAARRNALTHAMMREIGDAVARVGGDASLRALVLRGEGGFYCAGGDLGAMAQMPPVAQDGPDPLIASYRYFGDVLAELNRLPQAVISIVEGPAVGGGLGMVCCSDVVIMHRSARFGIPEPRVGFIPSQIIPFLVRRAGEGMVRQLAVTGVTIDAEAARACGIGRIVARDEAEIDRHLAEILADVQRMEPHALAAVKGLVLNCATDEDGKVMDDAARDLVGLLRRPAAREGMAAFMAKRLPPWAEAEDQPPGMTRIKAAGE